MHKECIINVLSSRVTLDYSFIIFTHPRPDHSHFTWLDLKNVNGFWTLSVQLLYGYNRDTISCVSQQHRLHSVLYCTYNNYGEYTSNKVQGNQFWSDTRHTDNPWTQSMNSNQIVHFFVSELCFIRTFSGWS